MTLLMKFFHVATAIWFISGLLGRTLTMWQASRISDVAMVSTLVRLAGYFERWMVIPGSLAVLGFGLITTWVQRWPIFGSTQGGQALWLLVSTLLYLSVIPIIKFIFLPRAKVFEHALESSLIAGTVTSALTAAFHDRVVAIAHAYELGITLVITLLMVLKPF